MNAISRQGLIEQHGFNNFDMNSNGERKLVSLAVRIWLSRARATSFHCFDIGMNMGEYSEMVITDFSDANIYGVEAIGEFAEKASARLGNKVKIIHTALGNSPGFLNIGKLNNGGRADTRIYKGEGVDDSRVITCKTNTLDLLFENMEISCLDLLKIDCDGFDFPILQGSVNTIKRYRPVVQFEYSCFWRHTQSCLYDALQLFNTLNYELFLMNGNSLIKYSKEPEPYSPVLQILVDNLELNTNFCLHP